MINIQAITKTYSKGRGIFNLSLRVKHGEVFGYLGPNGAGKTTTIRHLLGFITPDMGSCSINGLDCRKDAAYIQTQLGYIPGEIAFFDNMTGAEFLNFMNSMRGTVNKNRCNQLIDRLELDTSRKIKKMSKGMKQKLGIITAMMHDPAVYIFDEPTSGLDPLMQNVFVELVLAEKERGKTILMSSHIFDEIDRTCDRVGIIRDGKLVAADDIHSIKASQNKIFAVSVASETDIEILKKSGLKISNVTHRRVEVTIFKDFDLFTATLAKCKVTGLDALPQTLEQIFMKYYGQEAK
jgi:ABC-2 type transport system ATP-binding protein